MRRERGKWGGTCERPGSGAGGICEQLCGIKVACFMMHTDGAVCERAAHMHGIEDMHTGHCGVFKGRVCARGHCAQQQHAQQ